MAAAREVWKLALLVCVALGAGALIAEFAVRMAAPQPGFRQTRGLYVEDSAAGYRLASEHRGVLSNVIEYATIVATSRDGLRDDGPATGAHRRVVFLGDSFVFGQGVEAGEALPALVQNAMRTVEPGVEVRNAGVPGYGTAQEVAWLRRHGIALEPDLVVIGIFLGNDLDDNARPGSQRWQLVGPGGTGKRAFHAPVTEALYAHFHLYRLARLAATRLATRLRSGADPIASALADRYLPDSNALERKLAATREALVQLARIRDSMEIPVLAVLIPESLQVHPNQQAAAERALGAGATPDWRLPNRVFSELLAQHRIPFLDLTDRMTRLARDSVLYWPVDGHWNAAGHRAAADTVASWVRLRHEWQLR